MEFLSGYHCGRTCGHFVLLLLSSSQFPAVAQEQIEDGTVEENGFCGVGAVLWWACGVPHWFIVGKWDVPLEISSCDCDHSGGGSRVDRFRLIWSVQMSVQIRDNTLTNSDAYVHPGDPLMPLHLFVSRGYLAMVITAMVGSCVYYSMNVLWPQQIAYLFPGTAIHNGWLACIVGSATLAGQIVGGILCQYIPKSRWILIGSCLSLTAFSASMVSLGPGDEAKGIGLMFMACFSVGVIETCSLALAPLACASEDLGAALGALGSIRSGGASVATAIYSTILSNKLSKLIPEYVTPAALNAGLPSSSLTSLYGNLTAGTLANVTGINEEIIGMVVKANAEAAAKSFQYVWYAVIAFAALAVGAACLTIDYGEYLTDEVARKMHGATVGVKSNGDVVETEREKVSEAGESKEGSVANREEEHGVSQL
jgi:hypothetical protein